MDRYLKDPLAEEIDKKILLLTGPRQCGKTTLSKMLTTDFQYINHDLAEHRLLLSEKSWDRDKTLIIFDELHKMHEWKSWLKGIYDVEGIPPGLMVTGSARLDAFRKVGDSLAGRHFQFRLHPIDLKEALAYSDLEAPDIFTRLMAVGGFPEPFLNGTTRYYNRWKRSHIDLILKEDLLILSAVRDIQSIETLIELLRSRVGSPVSSNSLAQDLRKSPNTIQSWLKLLEDLYVIFRVTPYHKNIARSILKEPKFYFYDNGMVMGDDGIKLENLVACALLKEIHRCQDVEGENCRLHYVRNKDGQEIDFLVTRANKPERLIEVKWADNYLSPHFKKFFPRVQLKRVQVVGELKQSKSYPSAERIEPAIKFLSELSLEAPVRS
jgi:predicted AAA+ superfamily ATPase